MKNINELENVIIETTPKLSIQSKKNENKAKHPKTSQNISSDLTIIEVQDKRFIGRTEYIPKEIMARKFLNLIKIINLQIQESQEMVYRKKKKQAPPNLLKLNCCETEIENNLKSSQKKSVKQGQKNKDKNNLRLHGNCVNQRQQNDMCPYLFLNVCLFID